MSLTKQDVRRAFPKLKGAAGKEAYLEANGIRYTHDSRQNLVMWCRDGVLEMMPFRGARK